MKSVAVPTCPQEGRLGKYILGGMLKKGNFGKVFFARHEDTGQELAIKFTRKKLYPDRSHLYQEVTCMQQLQHNNILKLHEVLETEDHLVLVTDYISGGDLEEHLDRYGPLSELQARLIFRQVLSAVQYMHAKHITHRDLKPGNILLTENLKVKIADFGTSKSFLEQPLMTLCGTPTYMAPEIIHQKTYGPQVDVWSLGVTLFQMVTGYIPFEDSGFLKTDLQRLQLPYVDFLTPELNHLLGAMLRVDPEERATLGAIMRDPWVNHHMDDLPLYSDSTTSISTCTSATPCLVSSQLSLERAVSCPPALPSSTCREGQSHGQKAQESIHLEDSKNIPMAAICPAPQHSPKPSVQTTTSSSNNMQSPRKHHLSSGGSRASSQNLGPCRRASRRVIRFLRRVFCCVRGDQETEQSAPSAD